LTQKSVTTITVQSYILGLQSKRALLRYMGRVPVCSIQTSLFVKDKQIPLKQSTVEQLFRKLKKRANIPRLHPHLLRHSFATRYLQHGGDIYSLQQILGHTTLAMVRRYVHLIPSDLASCHTRFSPLDNLMKTSSKP
jgi:integrase/recombinase XerC/integrase/recombinase XerD